MNLCDCTVTQVLGVPYEKYGRWWVTVIYDSWGRESQTDLMFYSYEAALAVKPGHQFLA